MLPLPILMARREMGIYSPKAVESDYRSFNMGSLDYACNLAPVQSIQSMKVDPQDYRYLLYCGGEFKGGHLGIIDIEESRERNGKKRPTKFITKIPTTSCCFSCCWYPLDSGMFFTAGSNPEGVKVWDTNECAVVHHFKIPFHVYSIAVEENRSTIAAAGKCADIRICDIVSGASIHHLQGHKGAVNCVAWSPKDDFILISGGSDGTIRVWDVRRSGTLCVLDQTHCKQMNVFSTSATSKSSNHSSQEERFRVKPLFGDSDSGSSSSNMINETKGKRNDEYKKMKLKKAGNALIAHNKPIQSMCFTPDGRFLISIANDIKVWEGDGKYRNLLINFGKRLQIASPFGIESTTSFDGETLFVPSRNEVLVFDTYSGQQLGNFNPHLSMVTTCCYNSERDELFSAGIDNFIGVYGCHKVKKDTEQKEEGSDWGSDSHDEEEEDVTYNW